MGATSPAQQLTCPIAPARMFKALMVESNALIPKLLPQFIKSAELVQGDGGAGSIEQVNFTEASHFKYMRHRIDGLDKENFVCKYMMVEGDALGYKLESINYEVKFEAIGNGGSVSKMKSNYNTKKAFQVEEAEIKAGKEKATAIFRVVESYLLENPQAYVQDIFQSPPH